MVATGLQTAPHVSHFALAAHLTVAFITFAYIFWVALDLIFADKNDFATAATPTLAAGKKSQNPATRNLSKYAFVLIILLFVQIIYGAFVAGLKAGLVYNTWPKMGDEWIAESVSYTFAKDGISSLFFNMASVQFVHRTVAIILFIFVSVLWFKRNNSSYSLSLQQRHALNIAMSIVLLQFTLGVFTLLFAVPIWLGVLHQAGAFVLLGTVVYLLHRLRFAR